MLAQRIVPELEAADEPELEHDPSTNALIRRYRRLRRLSSGAPSAGAHSVGAAVVTSTAIS